MERDSYVYMLASEPYGTLYIGVTSDLIARAYQHRNDVKDGFTKKYGVHILVWFEVHADIREAILREKQLKHWKRRWKTDLVTKHNPTWRDLYLDFTP